ncbi:MAG: hypothetical protein RL660_2519 [Bacteroidota bacterium]|jgi:hypothetical protein
MAKAQISKIIDEQKIINRIYLLRGEKVMLDRDLAELYNVETKRLKEQVRRNIERFPEHFMFELSKEENDALRSQFATLKQGEHSKYQPFAFTEHGVLMLANVIKSKSAIDVSLKIIEIFVALRKEIALHNELLLKFEQLDKKMTNIAHDVKMHDGEIESIFELINDIKQTKLLAPPRTPIGFRTQATRNNDPEMKAAKPKTVKRK